MKNKRLLILGLIATAVVVLGIGLALLLTPVTTFLSDGTGADFRNAGSCRAHTAEQQPIPTENIEIIVLSTPAPEDGQTPVPVDGAETPVPVATAAPIEETSIEKLYEIADTSMMKDIVNILLVGVDFSEERLTWSGKKEWHSDVMIVLSVNFSENRADLISLPRDTYAKIPDVKGIYKLNASINCGGGLYRDDGSFNPAGLEKVCDAAEWMLGGIPVDYYYAVTMTSLKSLVDAFGGLDYDMDIAYTIQGRSYQKGMQHMDGQAVLDYCRVRKGSNGLASNEQGDANRVNRQKRILIAFFEHMQKQNLITKIPDILNAFKGELFTNCTPAQTAALAAFAYGLDRANIGMYSMGGSGASLFQWNFVFTDQANRVKIIKEIYGVDVDPYREYTLKYARYRWGSMLYDTYMPICTKLQKAVQKMIEEDDKLPSTDTEAAEPGDTPPTVDENETVDVRVYLEWDDSDNAAGDRPTEVPVTLLADGKATSWKGTISEDPKVKDKWEITFQGQPKYRGGAEISYSVEVDQDDPAYASFRDTYKFRADGSVSKGIRLRGIYSPVEAASGGTQTQAYSEADRAVFEEFKQAVKDLKNIMENADAAAKKERKGKSNQLNSVAVALLDQLEKTQELAIRVAEIFDYTGEKNITTPFTYKQTGWKTASPWAVNYGLNSGFNAVRVDFN